jgi:hypothetical protein
MASVDVYTDYTAQDVWAAPWPAAQPPDPPPQDPPPVDIWDDPTYSGCRIDDCPVCEEERANDDRLSLDV